MRRLVRASGICAVVLLMVTGCTALGWLDGNGDGFDAERWRQAQQGCVPDNPRLGMFDELESELLRERPTRSEVLQLLGPPDAGEGPGSVRYMLGYNIIDCDWVEIRFGPDDRVVEARYVQG
jgi:hypothetical protein